MHDRIYQLVVEQNEISWKSIIFDLIRTEQMDPWDVNVSLLSQKYTERLREYKQMDLKISGKVLLAAAVLLRIKSNKLVGDDLNEFDRLLAGGDMTEEQFYDDLEKELHAGEAAALKEEYQLMPRMPLPRRRKVSVYDLVRALEKALEVKHRRVLRNVLPPIPVPTKKFDINAAILGLFNRIKQFFGLKPKVTFSELLPSQSKHDKVYTFIPLLYLANQQKVELVQEQPFGEIIIQPRGSAEQSSAGLSSQTQRGDSHDV